MDELKKLQSENELLRYDKMTLSHQVRLLESRIIDLEQQLKKQSGDYANIKHDFGEVII